MITSTLLKKKVNIGTIDKVKEFVNLTSKTPLDVDLVSGRYIIDAKSIMGIFSLDLSKNIDLYIHADNEEEAEDYLNSITKFLVV